MKLTRYCLPFVSVLVVACGNGGYSGGSNPLDTAGGRGAEANLVESGFRPGEFVEAAMANTAFFRNKPAGEAEADSLLAIGTPMKVIAIDGSYVKVERDSGEVGYVPEIMLAKEGQSLMPEDIGPVQPVDGEEPVEIIPLDPGAAEEGPSEDEAPSLPTGVDPDDA